MSTSFPTSSGPAAARAAGSSPRPRPTVVLGALVGGGAALLGLSLCAVVGLIGWYLSDAGSHGDPNSGLGIGVRGWLLGHGTGLEVDGTPVTLLPLGLTLVLGWLAWQVSLRLGEMVWDHGPDEARAGDGERDFTVLLATLGYVGGYLAVALVAASAAAGEGGSPEIGAVLRWSLLFTALFGGVGIAIGSGRAALWVPRVPVPLQDAVRGAGALLAVWCGVSLLLFVVAMVLGLADAVDTVQRLGTTPAETFLLLVGCLVLVPHAVLFASAFLAGPGFAVGTGTAVAPAGVVLGPLPLVPLLGALPDDGAVPGWWVLHLAVPVLVAVVVVARRHRFLAITDWSATAFAGAGAGLGAAILLGLLTSLSSGAAGPGRMSEVGASGGEVFLAVLMPFVGGGLVGALLATWWVRRSGGAPVSEPEQTVADAPGGEEPAEASGTPDSPAPAPVALPPEKRSAPESVDADVELTLPSLDVSQVAPPAPEPEPEPEPVEPTPEPSAEPPAADSTDPAVEAGADEGAEPDAGDDSPTPGGDATSRP